MGAPAKARRQDASMHMYVQLALFFSIMTGLNLMPDAAEVQRQHPPAPASGSNSTREAPPISTISASDSITVSEPYPANRVRWGSRGRPAPEISGQFEIWDISQSPTKKMVRLFNDEGQYPAGLLPDATIFLEPGGRVRLPVAPGTYRIEAIAGNDWNGRDFGPTGVKVGFRSRTITARQLTVLAIGAEDEPVIELDEKNT